MVSTSNGRCSYQALRANFVAWGSCHPPAPAPHQGRLWMSKPCKEQIRIRQSVLTTHKEHCRPTKKVNRGTGNDILRVTKQAFGDLCQPYRAITGATRPSPHPHSSNSRCQRPALSLRRIWEKYFSFPCAMSPHLKPLQIIFELYWHHAPNVGC